MKNLDKFFGSTTIGKKGAVSYSNGDKKKDELEGRGQTSCFWFR